jgi:hypothetical protein
MTLLRTILAELWGLFVDDGLLAFGLVLWVALAAILLPILGLEGVGGPALFLGAALVFAASVLRRS